MPLLESAGAAVAGGVITVLGQTVRRRYNAPTLTLDWYSNQAASPAIIHRTIATSQAHVDNAPDTETRHQAQDVHLLLENTGRTPARECQVKAEIYDEGSRHPQPVRLGTRIKPPILFDDLSQGEQARERTAPFQVNRNDSVLIDLLRLSTQVRSYEDGTDTEITDATLHTLASFRGFEFHSDTKYTIHITVTAANAKPAEFGLTLDWDGSPDEAALRSAINQI